MSPETRPQVRTEPIVHPRQEYLLELLKKPSLPEGADELIRQAIAEYDSVFGGPQVVQDGKRMVEGTFKIDLPDDGEEGVILAGRNHLLTVRSEGKEERTGELFTYVTVSVGLRNMDGVNLYPDWLRYVALDAGGNSDDTQFLLEIPDSLRGYNGIVEAKVFSGGSLSKELSIPIELR